MRGHRPEVADVFESCGSTYKVQFKPSREQRRVLRDISRCRTAALGGHKKKCDNCGHEEFFYNSCRNRHCPKCQGAATARWLSERAAELLDTQYFHVVFTLPSRLGPIALQNKRVIYGLLFRAASETLLSVAKDPKHLGAEIGFLAILHTWGQRLDHHPHVHCVVPGGGLSADRTRWICARDGFFLPVRVLSRLFREKFLSYLQQAFDDGKLEFHGKRAQLSQVSKCTALIAALRRCDWVVYCKPPFGGPQNVLKYLARYTHRVAISNQRLLSVRDGEVTFRYKDYRRRSRRCTMTLRATEFVRRFLQHVLPSSFHRIRNYGFLANRVRSERIALCRRFTRTTKHSTVEVDSPPGSSLGTDAQVGGFSRDEICPVCKQGHLLILERIAPRSPRNKADPPTSPDTS